MTCNAPNCAEHAGSMQGGCSWDGSIVVVGCPAFISCSESVNQDAQWAIATSRFPVQNLNNRTRDRPW